MAVQMCIQMESVEPTALVGGVIYTFRLVLARPACLHCIFSPYIDRLLIVKAARPFLEKKKNTFIVSMFPSQNCPIPPLLSQIITENKHPLSAVTSSAS